MRDLKFQRQLLFATRHAATYVIKCY